METLTAYGTVSFFWINLFDIGVEILANYIYQFIYDSKDDV